MGCAPGRNAAFAEVQVRHMPHPGQCMWMQHAAGRESSVSPISLWLFCTSVQCAGQDAAPVLCPPTALYSECHAIAHWH